MKIVTHWLYDLKLISRSPDDRVLIYINSTKAKAKLTGFSQVPFTFLE